MASNGSDWEDNLAQLAKEKGMFEDLGLTYLAFPGLTNIVREKVGAGEATAGTIVTPPSGEPGTKGKDEQEQEESQPPSPKQSQNV